MRSSTLSVAYSLLIFMCVIDRLHSSVSQLNAIGSNSSSTAGLNFGTYAVERCKTGYVDLFNFDELSFSKSVDAVRDDVELNSQLQCNNCQRSGFPVMARCTNNDFQQVVPEKISWSCSAEFPNAGYTVEYSHLDCLPQNPEVNGCVKLDSCIMTITVTSKYPWGLVIGILGGYVLVGVIFLMLDRKFNILHSEHRQNEDDAPPKQSRTATCHQDMSAL